MAMNKVAASMLVKTLSPAITKLAENGKIDGFIRHLKTESSKYVELLEGQSVEVMITTEAGPENTLVEYVSLVVFDSIDKRVVRIINSRPVGEMIVNLLNAI